MDLEFFFYDDYWNPINDFDGLSINCKSRPLKDKFEYIHHGNMKKIDGNYVRLSQFKIISRNFLIENYIICQIENLQNSLKASDHFFQTISHSLRFNLLSCSIGQIIRENECVACQGGYSLSEPPKINDRP